jgi:hypothetical protein
MLAMLNAMAVGDGWRRHICATHVETLQTLLF